jgi:hypothetical protein
MKNLLLLTHEDIQNKIPFLELKKVLDKHNNANELQKMLFRLKKNMQIISLVGNDLIKHILIDREIREDYQMLDSYIDKSGIPYELLLQNSPSNKKINTFLKYSHTFDDKEYWRNLAYAYILQDYLKLSRKKIVEIFSASREFRDELMNNEEKKYLKKLPQIVTIFRGGAVSEKKTGKFGISWTLDKEIAINFASKKGLLTKNEMIVHETKIQKQEIIAVFLERKESEVIWF